MPDDKSNTGPQDAARVNVHEDYEVRYWTGKFNCSETDLREAVNMVGVSAKNVEAYLDNNRTRKPVS